MLKNFKLVNADGLKGLMLGGRLIPFEKIDDTLAEQLISKTHVLERLAASPSVAVATTAEPAEGRAKSK